MIYSTNAVTVFLTFNLANKRRIIRVYDVMNKKDAYMKEIAL